MDLARHNFYRLQFVRQADLICCEIECPFTWFHSTEINLSVDVSRLQTPHGAFWTANANLG
jgi:hypothetical protein